MQQALAAVQAIGQEAGRLLYLALVAEQYGQAGQVKTGLHVLTEALASLKPQEPRLWEPELYRVRGRCSPDWGESGIWDRDVRRATRDAGRRDRNLFPAGTDSGPASGGKVLELRAVMGLSRLWQAPGQAPGSVPAPGEVYGGFTEGFDTVDLREAKALLDKLGT